MDKIMDARSRLLTLRALFVLAHVLFLWMYFSADTLERMARQHLISGSTEMDLIRAADQYASAWRHGMAGNSFLYLPGFFATAAMTWVWSLGRPWRKLAVEGTVFLAVASLIAALLSPLGAARSVCSFEQATGLHGMGSPTGLTAHGVGVAIYTIFTWDVEMMCCQFSIAKRSFRLMWIPIALNFVLAKVRPWTVSDFTRQWFVDVAQGKEVGVISAITVPVLAAFLVWYQLKGRHCPAQNCRPEAIACKEALNEQSRSGGGAEPIPLHFSHYDSEADGLAPGDSGQNKSRTVQGA